MSEQCPHGILSDSPQVWCPRCDHGPSLDERLADLEELVLKLQADVRALKRDKRTDHYGI